MEALDTANEACAVVVPLDVLFPVPWCIASAAAPVADDDDEVGGPATDKLLAETPVAVASGIICHQHQTYSLSRPSCEAKESSRLTCSRGTGHRKCDCGGSWKTRRLSSVKFSGKNIGDPCLIPCLGVALCLSAKLVERIFSLQVALRDIMPRNAEWSFEHVSRKLC